MLSPRVAVVVFPGSNDDRDAAWALRAVGAEAVIVWHGERELPDVQAVVLPVHDCNRGDAQGSLATAPRGTIWAGGTHRAWLALAGRGTG